MTAVADESLEKALAKVVGAIVVQGLKIRDDWCLSSQHEQSEHMKVLGIPIRIAQWQKKSVYRSITRTRTS